VTAAALLPPGAPLAAQYIAALQPTLPEDVRRLPVTSSRHRLALHDAALAAGWPLRPSRRELARGAAYLQEAGHSS
jgi:hypothetical protein